MNKLISENILYLKKLKEITSIIEKQNISIDEKTNHI